MGTGIGPDHWIRELTAREWFGIGIALMAMLVAIPTLVSPADGIVAILVRTGAGIGLPVLLVWFICQMAAKRNARRLSRWRWEG